MSFVSKKKLQFERLYDKKNNILLWKRIEFLHVNLIEFEMFAIFAALPQTKNV
jgi:hypothetical protein